MNRHNTLILAALALFPIACNAVPVTHPDLVGTSSRMEHTETCYETRCQHFTAECERTIAGGCTTCEGGCVASGGSLSTCRAACGCNCHLDCSDPVSQSCYRAAYTFRLSNNRNEALASACADATTRGARCNTRSVDGDCDVIGRVERPELERNYRCIAETPCGSTPDCGDPVAGTLGDEIDDKQNAICSSADRVYNADVRPYFNYLEPWLRDDSLEAIRTCLTAQSCQPFNACITAFLRATYAPQT